MTSSLNTLATEQDSLIFDVKTIRLNLRMGQSQFAELIGVSPRTLENWEQGHRKPTRPAQALLSLIKEHPDFWVERLTVKGTTLCQP